MSERATPPDPGGLKGGTVKLCDQCDLPLLVGEVCTWPE